MHVHKKGSSPVISRMHACTLQGLFISWPIMWLDYPDKFKTSGSGVAKAASQCITLLLLGDHVLHTTT